MKDVQLLKKISGQSLPALIVIMSVVYAFPAYFPFIGHCFVGDDYFRLDDNSQDKLDLLNLRTNGFFRPINHLSFFLVLKLLGINLSFIADFDVLFTIFTVLICQIFIEGLHGSSIG